MYHKILVTGGSGMVGTALKSIRAEYPRQDFHFFGSRDCDLTKLNDVMSFWGDYQPDAILHLAAVSGGVELSTKFPASLLRDNVYMNMNVLEASRHHNVKKVVMMLSSGMYPADAPNPLLERYIHDGPPHESNFSYAFAKRLIEPSIRAYRTEYGMNVVGLVPNGIYGENGNFSHRASVMWAALIRRFFEARYTQDRVMIWGDGSPLREHTYSKDIARASMWCLDNYNEFPILNIGSTEEHSVKEIAYFVAEAMGVDKGRIHFDKSKPAGIHRKSTDNSPFVALSGFQYTPFSVGIEQTIRWFCENYDTPGRVRL